MTTERGSTKHGPHLDDELKHETQALRQGGRPGHVEEWREGEPSPDDTDPQEVRDAVREASPDAPSKGGTEQGEGGEAP